MYILKNINPLLRRVIFFVSWFVVVSGLIGPRVIDGGILFRDGFAIYGSMGKGLIFAFVVFVLLARHRKVTLHLRPWSPILLGWLALSLACVVLAWTSITHLVADQRNLPNLWGAHGGLWLSVLFATIGCFGPHNIQLLATTYRREIAGAGALAALFYVFLLLVYSLWGVLAHVVLVSVGGLLELAGLKAVFILPHTLLFDKFGITIAQYCSGIESIALFTGLYAVVGLLDWRKLHTKRYFAVFPLALLVLFGLNILRVFGLILAGYYINPQIAFSLFHTYAGLVFFVIYSAIFWSVAYKYLLPAKKLTPSTSTLI